MIPFDEAYKIVMDSAYKLETEIIPFEKTLNRVLGEPIFSDMDMPPFDKSAMDGYACRMSDLKNELTVIEIIAAGQIPEKEIKENQCTQIMTGAPVPKGADCVIMVEHSEKVTENTIRFIKDSTKSNIIEQAQDVKKNQLVLEKGTLLKPQHIAVLASVGASMVRVYKKAKVGVISTGDEIVEPDLDPNPSQIRNSNGYQLLTQIERIGAEANYIGIAADNEGATYNTIVKGLKENDVLLLTGGVSMGEFDFVPYIMEKVGIDIKFQKVAVQPGKPTTFGVKDRKRIFGLPGNPVSSYIQFELMTKPLILSMMGHDYKPLEINLPMGVDHKRKRAERMAWFPVIINEEGKVIPVNYHGSAHIHGLQHANGISYFPISQHEIKEGETVHVRLI